MPAASAQKETNLSDSTTPVIYYIYIYSLCTGHTPVGDVVDEVLLEHEAPALDDVEQGLLEGLGVHPEPVVEDLDALNALGLLVDLLVCVNLKTARVFLGVFFVFVRGFLVGFFSRFLSVQYIVSLTRKRVIVQTQNLTFASLA